MSNMSSVVHEASLAVKTLSGKLGAILCVFLPYFIANEAAYSAACALALSPA